MGSHLAFGGVSNDLLKCATGTVLEYFAEAVFEQQIALEVLDKGILVALPKPGKPLGHTHQPPPNSALVQCA